MIPNASPRRSGDTPRGGNRRWLIEYPRAIPILIFLLVTAVTILSVYAIEQGERQREAAELERRAQTLESAIERRAYAASSFLRAGAALFGSQDEVTPELFRTFVSELRLDSDYRGAEGIGYAPMISASEVPAFETELREGRTERIVLFPSLAQQPRDVLVPVRFIYPDTPRSRRALGYDMVSHPVRRAAMEIASRTERPTASRGVVLLQDRPKAEPGFIIYMPVFVERGDARVLQGFIYSPFNAREFLRSAAELTPDSDAAARLSEAEGPDSATLAEFGRWGTGGMTTRRTIEFANNRMMLSVRLPKDNTLSPLGMITLLFGLAVALLLLIVARLLTQQAQEDSRSLEWFAEQNSIRNSLTRELNHRVKNTLANVLSIVSLTRRRAATLDEFAEGIDARIRALSATHDLLTQSEWGTTPIRSVVEVELAPYVNTADHDVVIAGPHVELAPNDALSLGLAVHELATNAAKYGALSQAGGRVEIGWHRVGEQLARIDWTESGGPQVTAPRRRGFGTDLIEKIVAHELRHPVKLVFDPGGVRCTLLTPVRRHSDFELRAETPGANRPR